MSESRLSIVLTVVSLLLMGVLILRPQPKIPPGIMDQQPSARFAIPGNASVEITKFPHETLDEWRVRCAAILKLHLNRK